MISLCLFFSAFIPMYGIILVQLLVEIINGNLTFNVLNTITIVLISIMVFWGTFGLIYAIRKKPSKMQEIKILSIKNITDQHFFGYISIFILFTLGFDLGNMSMVITTAIILSIIGFVYIHNKIFYINPLLNICGFSFYEITYITRDNETPKTAKVFYHGHKEIEGKWVTAKLCLTNFTFIGNKKGD